MSSKGTPLGITIKKHKPYELKPPKFICDKKLKDDVPAPYHLLVNGYRFITILGRPGSGKTSMLISLFRDKKLLKRCYNNIILVIPRESLNSLSKKDNIFKDIADEKFFTSLTDIDAIREMVKFYAEEGENSCIIIDDQTSYLKDAYIQKILSDIVFNRRHYRCSIMLLSQVYNSIPLKIRKLINICMIMYKPSKKETQDIFEELLEHKEEVANEIFHMAFQKPFDVLLIDVPTQTIFSNSNEIIVSDK